MADPEKRPTTPTEEEPVADERVDPVRDEDTGEDVGEVAGGGEITDMGGDSPSS